MIFDYFDKIYCINLPDATERWKLTKGEFKSIGLTNVKRMDGIYDPDGYIGCNKAHVSVFKDAKANGYEKILIFEDDVHFLEYAVSNLEKSISDIEPDWDLFYLGGYLRKVHDPNILLSEIPSDEEYVKSYEHYTKISNNLIQLTGGSVVLMHAYAIKYTMFDEIIDRFSKIDYVKKVSQDRYDSWMSVQIKDRCDEIKTFMSCPMIAVQRPCFSHIQKRYRDLDALSNGVYKELLKFN